MRISLILVALLICSFAYAGNESECRLFINKSENIKKVHLFKPCLMAAKNGSAMAQYSVGMSYGFSKELELEREYYLKAANQKAVAAYLALGHSYNKSHPWKAIYWYQRKFYTRTEGSGYAALLISNIFKRLELYEQGDYWVVQCKKTSYSGC